MKNTISILCTGLLIILLYSCQEDEIFEDLEKESTNIKVDQLGEKLENPFSVVNMRKALDSLKVKNEQYRDKDFEVETTHLYLRFKPKDEQELNILEADSTLVLYSFPLDREIPESLTSYHDSSIPKNKPTFQYCAVPVTYDFPHDIKVKILEELYLPEEDQRTAARSSGNLLYDLEKEAFAITGNEFDKVKSGKNNTAARNASFTPSGRIRVWDDVIGSTTTTTRTFSHWEYYDCGDGDIPLAIGSVDTDLEESRGFGSMVKPIEPIELPGECKRAVYTYHSTNTPGSYIPIEGVKVRARRWFTTKSDLTDSNGDFNITHSFGGDVNYLIVWEHAFWDIRDGNLTQAYYNGPQKSNPWNLNIGGGKSLRFATIHRACHRYTFEDVDNLSRPILGGGSKLKINYNDGEGTGVNWGVEWQNVDFGTGLLPNIKIWRSSENLERDWFTNEIFSTTIHELAHTTHIQEMNWGTIDYGQVRPILYESWADAVEWYLTRKEYIERGEADYDDPTVRGFRNALADNKQWWNFNDSHEYTPIFIDLIDDYNQATQFEPTLPVDNSKPNENITGYWMQTIEDVVLKDAYGLTSLRSELKRT
ncbi:hypothetical protein QYS49_38985 [Marivirga salinae]|uniref:Uncharacterized protein n=1 Tax=Marivirga salinarum TaxID=3059078 RepID=A0AA51NAT6_9BACT|nr:hypothetical protein [Marivirga sp. BDSF4-3]WMN11604.1 hypothetical protein QYS49_38985 [Marivirga sp. BDSF4-3]